MWAHTLSSMDTGLRLLLMMSWRPAGCCLLVQHVCTCSKLLTRTTLSILQALAVEGRRSSKTLQHLQDTFPAATDLIVKMLRAKPHQRITAAEAMQHAYVQPW